MVSIVFTHYAMTPERSELARSSAESLIQTTKKYPCELIVVDNGRSLEDSQFFLQKTQSREITHYLRNADNNFFSRARNQGLRIASGEYIAVVDNDIIFKDGWIEQCVRTLQETSGFLVTPIGVIPSHRKHSFQKEMNGKTYTLNPLAGSNCWMMKRSDYESIGEFEDNIISGTLWCRRYSRMGYGVIVLERMAQDFGKGKTPFHGYQKRGILPAIEKTLTNGEKVRIL